MATLDTQVTAPVSADGSGSLLPLLQEGKPAARGWVIRRIVQAVLIFGGLMVIALDVSWLKPDWIAQGLIYAIIGLSLHVLLGYAGQISLGHHAFVGVGAFTSALLVTKAGLSFWLAIFVAAGTGALTALLLGVVALRLRGLVLALVTFAYGQVAVNTIFALPVLTGGGAGVTAPRPAGFDSEITWAYLMAGFLAVFWFLDWRLTRTKAGRAIMTIRENEIGAASFGINVVGYKILAFVLSGAIAGMAGTLFAFKTQQVVDRDFEFIVGLTFVLMVVVGGLGSRVGVFLASMFFGIFPLIIPTRFIEWLEETFSFIKGAAHIPDLVGGLLLLFTLTLYPGGLGQQIKPITDWFAGKPFSLKHHETTISSGGAGVRP